MGRILTCKMKIKMAAGSIYLAKTVARTGNQLII